MTSRFRFFAGAMLFASVVAVPLLSSADTMSDLQAEIQSLLSQINQLQPQTQTQVQSQIQTAPTTQSASTCPQLYRSLSLGASGSDVANLQEFLLQSGDFSANVTGYFGPITQAAVQQWQSAHGIVSGGDAASTGFGVVGPHTIAAIAQSCAQNAPQPNSSCPVAPPPTTVCSTGWQANTDANGCTTSYKCAIPLPGGGSCQSGYVMQNGMCVLGNTNACTAIALSCPAGEYDYADASCHHSCVSNNTTPNTGSLSAAPQSGAAPLQVTFTTSKQGSSLNGTISFGDGTSAQMSQPIACTSSVPSTCSYSLTHTYSANGTFTALLYSDNILLGTTNIYVGSTYYTNANFTASPQSGAAPLTVTFSATRGDTVNFGDGTTGTLSGVIPGQCSVTTGGGTQTSSCTNGTAGSVSHTYTQNGSYTAQLIQSSYYACAVLNSSGATQTNSGCGTVPASTLATATITVGGSTSGAPSLSSVSPTSGPVGTKITLTGSGFITTNSQVDRLILDGHFALVDGGWQTSNDTSLTVTLAGYMYDMNACANAPAGMSCDPAALTIPAGQHTIAVQNSKGTSNALTFNVTSYQGSAAIDQSSLTTSSSNPTITGTASGVSQITLSFVIKDIGYTTDPINVVNGHWSVQLLSAPHQQYWGSPPPSSFLPGTYQLQVLDSATNLPLTFSTNSTLTVTQ
jgi:PKD repeat protein